MGQIRCSALAVHLMQRDEQPRPHAPGKQSRDVPFFEVRSFSLMTSTSLTGRSTRTCESARVSDARADDDIDRRWFTASTTRRESSERCSLWPPLPRLARRRPVAALRCVRAASSVARRGPAGVRGTGGVGRGDFLSWVLAAEIGPITCNRFLGHGPAGLADRGATC